MTKDSPTHKEHFIPETILKHHSCRSVKKKKKTKYYTYIYDKFKDHEWESDISEIFFEKDLYEIYNEDGNIDPRIQNLIEDCFANVLEPIWGNIIPKIIKKENLTEEDKVWLYLLFALQILRMPSYMKMTRNWLEDATKLAGKTLTKNEIDKCLKIASFVWGESTPEINWILYKIMLPLFQGKNLVIYRTNDSNFILSGDKPILAIMNNSIMDFYFPISSHICLGLVENSSEKEINASNEFVDFINTINYENTNYLLCSSKSIKDRKECFCENNEKNEISNLCKIYVERVVE